MTESSATSKQVSKTEEFILFLQHLGTPEERIHRLSTCFDDHVKEQYLHACRIFLKDNIKFTREDEEIIIMLDHDRNIDSISFSTLKFRILNAQSGWIKSFCNAGGNPKPSYLILFWVFNFS